MRPIGQNRSNRAVNRAINYGDSQGRRYNKPTTGYVYLNNVRMDTLLLDCMAPKIIRSLTVRARASCSLHFLDSWSPWLPNTQIQG